MCVCASRGYKIKWFVMPMSYGPDGNYVPVVVNINLMLNTMQFTPIAIQITVESRLSNIIVHHLNLEVCIND